MYMYIFIISLFCITFILLIKVYSLSKKINVLEKNYSIFLEYSRNLAYSIKDIQDYLLKRDGHLSENFQTDVENMTLPRPPFFKSIVGEA